MNNFNPKDPFSEYDDARSRSLRRHVWFGIVSTAIVMLIWIGVGVASAFRAVAPTCSPENPLEVISLSWRGPVPGGFLSGGSPERWWALVRGQLSDGSGICSEYVQVPGDVAAEWKARGVPVRYSR